VRSVSLLRLLLLQQQLLLVLLLLLLLLRMCVRVCVLVFLWNSRSSDSVALPPPHVRSSKESIQWNWLGKTRWHT
jgi:hypothetical protein